MRSRPLPEPIRKQIEKLPERPGVYFFKDADRKPVYIGKAVSIRKRVGSHFRFYGEVFSKEGKMLQEVRSIDALETPTESEALLLEASLIKEHQPKYNREMKDDKSYPFLKITDEEFPRLLVVRGRKGDSARYFGPYTNATLLRRAVRMLRRLFPMRTCQPMPNRVCLMYHIGQCKGPCVGEIDRARYREMVKELELFLDGHHAALVRSLSKRMREHSAKREYEKARTLYEEIRALATLPRLRSRRIGQAQVLEALKDAFSLPRLPERIEAFDISNIAGREAVGSMVVFVNGEPARSQYRRFRIKTVEGIDDYRMMQEVVRRRYARVLEEKKDLPGLVVIDGGRGHLAAVKAELGQMGLGDLPVIAIAKEHEYLFSPDRASPHVYPPNSPLLQLIQRLRDEAHRFAIAYHRRLHKKEALASRLDAIPGVGPKTREKLIKQFGSVSAIAKASAEEIRTCCAISQKTAAKIIEVLNS